MHTPGPWVVIYDYKNGAALRIEAPNSRAVAGCVLSIIRSRGIGMPACDIGKANARLIAAAPELLEALEDMIEDAEKQMANPSHHMPFSMNKAKAAIAKAKVPVTERE